MALAKIIKYEGDNSTFVWKSRLKISILCLSLLSINLRRLSSLKTVRRWICLKQEDIRLKHRISRYSGAF